MNESNEMNATELAALFGGENDLAGKASHRKAQITPLATSGNAEFYRLRLPNAECKMDVLPSARWTFGAVCALPFARWKALRRKARRS